MVTKSLKASARRRTERSVSKRIAAKPATKAAKQTKSAAQKKQPAKRTRESGALTHRLDALLHTMRCIAQHEDELCTLLHDARRTGRVNTRLLQELQTILEELPAEEYTNDLNAVREITTTA